MAELARGAVTDRPWGRTLATLGARALTGQLTVAADGKRFHIGFSGGEVVAASSPLASDAAVRVAMTGGLLSSTQVADIARRQVAAPARDEIELIAELARLAPDQVLRLHRRVIAQRAARTFAIERGDFVVADQIALAVFPSTNLDVRTVVYLGAQNIAAPRLDAELRSFGDWFRIRDDALADLAQYGFGDAEHGVLERLRSGAAIADLASLGVEPRLACAVVYALTSCNACEVEFRARARPVAAPPSPRTTTHNQARAQVERPPQAPRRRALNSDRASEVKALISHCKQMVASGADHFRLLGIAIDASPAETRKAYFALARQLHPDRLSALGIADETRTAQRLFAEVNGAFAVLADAKRRRDYEHIVRRGGEGVVRAEQAKAEEMALRVLDAEEAYQRGEMALRRDQLAEAVAEFARAIELNPDEADYLALHVWAQFCAATDKASVAQATRATLDRATHKSPKSVTARFYRGRVERMLGRDQEALRHFQEVLRISPQHGEAATEARLIEARLAAPESPSGLFRRKR